VGVRGGGRPSRALRWGAWAVAALVLAGCTDGGSGGDSADLPAARSTVPGAAGESRAPSGPVSLTVRPRKDATSVAPGDPVMVTAANGTISSVELTGDAGRVPGTLDAAKTTWKSTGQLAFGTRYTVTAEATGADGGKASSTSTFTTATAAKQVFPAVSPLRGMTVGVGMPIRVYFDAPVTDRKAALNRMRVTTSVPTQGAWRWFSSTEVHWRPKVYWRPGTKVALDTDLYGVKLGPGIYGGPKADRHIEFAVGRSHVSVADARTHQMKVYVNGRLVRTLPVSMGKEVKGQYTHSGVHVVTDKKRSMTMDSTTYGLALDAGGYRTKVEFATRISNSGEFVHSAPWSVAQQGRENVSHGCINLSPANAEWFFKIAQAGDVVEVRGTPVRLSARHTDVPDWTIPWDQWGE
jgi:lipoprotein-anchoring transpeptidase ErfK/SrfK